MRPTLENVRAVGDFATRYQWNLKFLSSPKGLSAPSAELNIRCETTALPVPKGEVIPIEIRGHVVHQPGKVKPGGSLSMTFVETVDNVVMNFLENWRKMIWAPNTGVQQKNEDVKCDIQMERLNRQDQVIMTDVVKGAFLLTFSKPPLDNANEAFKPVLTVQYDSYETK